MSSDPNHVEVLHNEKTGSYRLEPTGWNARKIKKRL